MNKALNHLRSQEFDLKKEDVKRLKPFIRKHINFLGRYSFTMPESIQNGVLRDLHIDEGPLEM